MKYFLYLFIFFLYFFSNHLLANNQILKKEKIFFSAELDWIPYSFYKDNLPQGYIVDYIKLLGEKENFEPIFINDTWDNNLKRFKEGRLDVLSAIAYSKKREEFILYTNFLKKQKLFLITHQNSYEFINLDDLNGHTIGQLKDWMSTTLIKNENPNIKIKEYNDLKAIFEDIKDKKIDATIQNELVSKFYINSNYLNSLKIVTNINLKNYDNSLYFGVQKNNIKLQKILNQAMEKVTEEELKALEKKWINLSNKLILTKEEKEFIKNTTIKVSFTDNWAPISFKENNKAYGLGFDFWDYIINKTGIKVEYYMQDRFYKSLEEIKNKTKDVIVTTGKTEDRSKYSIFSDIYYKVPIGIATLKDQNYIPSISQLKGKKIAVGKNYTAHKLLKENYPYLEFVFVNNIKEGLEFLSSNKVFALIDSMPVLAYNIKKYSFNNIKISGDANIDFNLQVMIRDDYKLLQSIINKTLNSMSLKEKEEIYSRWTNLEFIKPFDYELLIKILLPIMVVLLIILYKNRQLSNYKNKLENIQKELENSLSSFKTLLNFTVEGIIILQEEKIVFVNNQILKIFKFTKTELLNTSLEKLFICEKTQNIYKIVHNAQNSTKELNALNAKNESFPVLIKAKEMIFENKQTLFISIIDLTEIKQKERALLQQSKIASLSEMLGSIAHQWRQPLSFISTAITGLKVQKEFNQLTDESLDITIEQIMNKTLSLSKTINNFQNYLKGDREIKEFYISKSIEQVLSILNDEFILHKIKITTNLNEELKIYSCEQELSQIILNILKNSIEAFEKTAIENKQIKICIYKEGLYAVIEIIDNAGGIQKEIIDKIFDPYFTTKHQSQGTGLGLYMSHKILTQNMKGSLEISNYETTSAKVLIKIPFN